MFVCLVSALNVFIRLYPRTYSLDFPPPHPIKSPRDSIYKNSYIPVIYPFLYNPIVPHFALTLRFGLFSLSRQQILVYRAFDPVLSYFSNFLEYSTFYFVQMGGVEQTPNFADFGVVDFPLPAQPQIWVVNNDREATIGEYRQITRAFYDVVAQHYFIHTGPLAANVAAYNALPAWAKVLPVGLQRPLLLAACMEAATHGASAETINNPINVERQTQANYTLYAETPVRTRNHNAVGYGNRALGLSVDGGATLIAAGAAGAGTALRIDHMWLINACASRNVTLRQFFRRLAREFFFAIGKARRLRYEMGKQAGVPLAYGYLGTDFFDTVELTVLERAVYDAYKQVMLFRSARSSLLNSSNMYTGGVAQSTGSTGRFPAIMNR